jgi:hypothetical protein
MVSLISDNHIYPALDTVLSSGNLSELLNSPINAMFFTNEQGAPSIPYYIIASSYDRQGLSAPTASSLKIDLTRYIVHAETTSPSFWSSANNMTLTGKQHQAHCPLLTTRSIPS